MGCVDQQHIVKTPTGLIPFWSLGGPLCPAEAHAFSLGVMGQRQQVEDSAAVGGGPGGDNTSVIEPKSDNRCSRR